MEGKSVKQEMVLPLIRSYFGHEGMRKFLEDTIKQKGKLERQLSSPEKKYVLRRFKFLMVYHFHFHPTELGEVCGDLQYNPSVFRS